MPLLLSGPFDTSELPRVGSEPVTVTVGRVVEPGREADFERWAKRVVERVEQFPGSLGAGMLKPGEAGGEYQIVFRFADALSLRTWERSPERAELMRDVEEMVCETRIQRVVGVEDFLDAPGRAEPRRPVWKHLLIETAWGFPVVAAVSLYVGPRLLRLPFGLRTTLSMLVVGTIMRLGVGPVRGRLRRRRTLG